MFITPFRRNNSGLNIGDNMSNTLPCTNSSPMMGDTLTNNTGTNTIPNEGVNLCVHPEDGMIRPSPTRMRRRLSNMASKLLKEDSVSLITCKDKSSSSKSLIKKQWSSSKSLQKEPELSKQSSCFGKDKTKSEVVVSKSHFQRIKERRKLRRKSNASTDTASKDESSEPQVTEDMLTKGISNVSLDGVGYAGSVGDSSSIDTLSVKEKRLRRKVHFKINRQASRRTSLTKGTEESQTEEEKKITDAINRVYFYSKKERKEMRRAARVVVEHFLEEGGALQARQLEKVFMDSRNSNCTEQEDPQLIGMELEILKDWASSDVRGLEDMVEDEMFVDERTLAVQSVLGFQEYLRQEETQFIQRMGGAENITRNDAIYWSDRFSEGLRGRSLSVSRRSREFAVKMAIGDALEAKRYLEETVPPEAEG